MDPIFASAFETLVKWLEGFADSPWTLGPVISVATFSSEDLTCIAAGILSAKDLLPLWVSILACAVGIWIGDMGLYAMGYIAGHTRTKWKWLHRIVTEKHIGQGKAMFEKYGVGWLFVSRFLPGTRFPSYIGAGMVGWSLRKFALALAAASILWTPVIVGVSYLAGVAAIRWLEGYQKWIWPALIGAALLVWLAMKLVIPMLSWRGRRLLLSRWHRMTRWEFWPVWMVYPPVILYLLWEGWKQRCWTYFTASNPAIESSGFAMESKGDILDLLNPPHPDNVRVARYRRLPPGDAEKRTSIIESFLKESGLAYPIVLKPEIGERGKGVSVIRDASALDAWLEGCTDAALVQEHVEGEEFGVHWYRFPDAETGCIDSLAHKQTLTVTGDGVSTLETLILKHNRAIMMAPYFLQKFKAQESIVPAEGEEFVLAELGTHARGSVFADARNLRTAELLHTMDQLGKHTDGFYFGRYDVRVPTAEHLQQGRGLVVLELNGVSGEPAHVYHPGYPWLHGIRDLCRHWKSAAQVGRACCRRGHRPMKIRELLALAARHKNSHWFEADSLNS